MCNKICKSEKVILDGKEIILRNPEMRDVKSCLDFINSLVGEDAMILVNKKITLKEENEWLKEQLKQIKENKLHQIFATYKNEIIGNVEVRKNKWRQSHLGIVAISVKKDYRGIGLGRLLMKKIVEKADADPEIKILTLSVLEPNKLARRLYEKIGFKVVAKLSKRHFYKGEYANEYFMDYNLDKI